MNNDSQIPVLRDLLFKGHIENEGNQPVHSLDENTDFEIEQDDHDIDLKKDHDIAIDELAEDFEDDIVDEKDPSVQELIIDEEIRMILDKHMDKAYAEIIRLLNNKIS